MLNYFFKYYNMLITNLFLDLKYSEFTKRYIHWFQSSIPDHIIHWLENTNTLCLKITLNESPEELIFSISDQRKHTDKIIGAYLVAEKLSLTFRDKINLYTQQHALNKIVLNMNEKYFFIRDFLIPKAAYLKSIQALLKHGRSVHRFGSLLYATSEALIHPKLPSREEKLQNHQQNLAQAGLSACFDHGYLSVF